MSSSSFDMFLLDLFPTHESAEQFIAIHVCFQLLQVACEHCTSCVAPGKLQSSKALLYLGVLLFWSSGHELMTMAIF